MINVIVGQRALREIYLRGFEIAVRESKPWTIVSSYNRVNGPYTSESEALLEGVVRDDWGYDGVVMTDWFGGRDAVAQMKAGNELLMPGTPNQRKALLEALESGALPEAILDRNVERILELVKRTPAFKGKKPSDAPDLPKNALVGREAAAQGMVLLKNAGVLPLEAGATLALFGNGSYSIITGGTGSGDVNEAYSISLPQGLEAAGLKPDKALADAYTRHIAEQEAKRPAPARPFMPRDPIPELETAADEIARTAREAGHAIADVLTGRTPPSGKLATTFPVKWEDLPSSANFPGKALEGPDPNATGPFGRGDRAAEVAYDDDIWVGYRHFATKGVKPAYPFGFGLSYTTFEYSA